MSASDRKRKYAELVIRCDHQRQAISELARENCALNEEISRLKELLRWTPTSEIPPLHEDELGFLKSEVYQVRSRDGLRWEAFYDQTENLWIHLPEGIYLQPDYVTHYAPLLPYPM